MILALERRTSALALGAAALCLAVAAACAFYQVVTRFALGQPSTWSEVLTRSSMIWCVFLGLAPAFQRGGMIAVEIVPELFSGRARQAVLLAGIALSMLFFALLAWQGMLMTGRVAGQTLAALEISIAWVYAAIPVGSAFTLLALLAAAIRVGTGADGRATAPA